MDNILSIEYETNLVDGAIIAGNRFSIDHFQKKKKTLHIDFNQTTT